MVTQSDVQGWACGLDEVVGRIGPRFGRAEPRRRAAAYLQGLLAPMERKNGWQLAEAVGDRTPDGVQDFLSRVCWDADAVRDDLRAYAVEHLGDEGAVLVVDETGFIKKGTKSAGVQRQYTGTAGRIENSQVGVFLGYASHHGRARIDRALYLPESWAGDTGRRKEAHVPEDVTFATKPGLALAMLERARAAGVPCAWVTADSVYGAAYEVRRWIEEQALGYVLAVSGAQRFDLGRAADRAERIPADDWHRLSAGEGAKGPRLYDWAYVAGGGDAAPGFHRGLLVRRSIADPAHLTFYLTHALEGAALADLARVAGARWAIESCFEQAKGEVGLDQYEVRSWVGWHRHITLSMFALAFLSVVRKGAIGGCEPDGPRGRPAAGHRARGQAPAGHPRRPTTPQARSRAALVHVAPPTPATGQARASAPADPRVSG